MEGSAATVTLLAAVALILALLARTEKRPIGKRNGPISLRR
jgi:hypothetical protein